MIKYISLPFIAATIILASCSKFARIQKSDNVDLKYKAAVNYFDKRDYNHSITLFEEMISLLKGQDEGEKAQFYMAYCQYHQGQLILSAYSFKKFYEQYGRSELAEHAYYMHCVSLYEDSPDYELDQTNTKEALESIQHFLERYGKSKHLNDCNSMVDNLTLKLENKAYYQAMMYYKMGNYKSSVVVFDNLIKDFPSSRYTEECSFLKLDSQYKYAHGSIDTKKKERFQSAIESYLAFLDRYPDSRYLTDAGNIYSNSLDEIGKIEKPENAKKKSFWDFLGF